MNTIFMTEEDKIRFNLRNTTMKKLYMEAVEMSESLRGKAVDFSVGMYSNKVCKRKN